MSLEEKRQASFRRARSKALARYRTEHGRVIGRLRRHDGEDGFEATERAMTCQWWCEGLKLDGRSTRWWVWRQTKEGE